MTNQAFTLVTALKIQTFRQGTLVIGSNTSFSLHWSNKMKTNPFLWPDSGFGFVAFPQTGMLLPEATSLFPPLPSRSLLMLKAQLPTEVF